MRAQPPIVEVVKWTFAAARMAWASESVIQSAAEGMGHSGSVVGFLDGRSDFDGLDVASEPSPEAAAAGARGEDSGSEDPPSDAGAPPSDVDDPAAAELSSPLPVAEPVFTAARRSFFAHPEPL